MSFNIGEELTHSNGAFVQGGFITAMLDTSMAHLLIFKTNGEYNPLTLNINVNFFAPGTPGKFTPHPHQLIRWEKYFFYFC